jgi:hypothetical protein
MSISQENGRLDSWKAIAAYLGRDISTVIRWEKDKGLPVHRLPGGKRQAVFALTSEIDAWLVGRSAESADPLVAVEPAAAPSAALPRPRARRSAMTAALLILSLGGVVAWLNLSDANPVEGASEASGPAFTREDITIASPYSLAAGDLNGDGQLDLAVTAYRTNLLYGFLGRGDGGFQLASETGTGIKPDGVTLGDFNGDGVLDAVTANRDSHTVSVLYGTGDGRFRPRADHAVGKGPRGVTSGDLDGDGKLDVAVGNFADDSLTIRYGPETVERPAETYAVSGSPYQVRVADLNADGVSDLIVGNTNEEASQANPGSSPHTLSILLGTRGARFVPHARYLLGRGSSGIVVADLNNDTRLDLAVTSFEDHVIYVLAGRGDGTFGAPARVATGAAPLDVAASDVDGDGRIDLIVANAHDKSVSLLLGWGDGTFAPRLDFAVNSYPKSLAVGDFNNDTRPDIVVTNFLDNSISVLLNATPISVNLP